MEFFTMFVAGALVNEVAHQAIEQRWVLVSILAAHLLVIGTASLMLWS